MTEKFNGTVWEITETVPAGESRVIYMPDRVPATVSVFPGSGGSALLEFTTSGRASVAAETARWSKAAVGTAGVVSDTAGEATDIPSPITAIRVSATDADAVVEVLQ